MNGTTTGNLDRNTIRHTPIAPSPSCLVGRDPSRQVAAECTDKEGADLGVVRCDAQQRGVGEDHYQAENDLRYPVHRIEDTIGGRGRFSVIWFFYA